MALNNFHFIHTIKNSPAIFRRRFQKDRARSLSGGDPAFKVHYAGAEKIYSLRVEQASEVVQRLVAGDSGRACKDHVLVVRSRYLEVKEITSGRQLTKTYLHDIACCAADRAHPGVFLYICKNRKQLQCRVFRCSREEKAQRITACLAKVFEVAFSQWRASYGEGALPTLSAGIQALPEAQPNPSDQGSRRAEEAEAERSLNSDEEAEQRMHREFLHRATSFRAPHTLDTGLDNLEQLSRDLAVPGLVIGGREGDETHLTTHQPSSIAQQ